MAGFSRLTFRLFILLFILTGMIFFVGAVSAGTSTAGLDGMGNTTDPFIDSAAIFTIYMPFMQRYQATACGEILTDTVWTPDEGPYLVYCDVVILLNVTLTITAGTTVQFENASDDLIVNGGLQALGTQKDPIRFQPALGSTPGSWGRLEFTPGSSSRLDHAILEYGGSSEGMVYIASDGVQVVNSVVRFSAQTGVIIHEASPLISATQMMSNTSFYTGGGLYNDTGSPMILNNTFTGNVASLQGGGGLTNLSGNPTIRNNTFRNNWAQFDGEGIDNDTGSPTIENNTFTGNISVYTGGGIKNGSGHPLIQNNTLTDNRGNSGGGIAIYRGKPILRSNLIVNNLAEDEGGGVYNRDGMPTLDHNDVWNNLNEDYFGVDPGVKDISMDPLLVDSPNGDFHLLPGSPCIDAGDPDNHAHTDMDGEPRPMGLAPDIGADEVRAFGVVKTSSILAVSPGITVTYQVKLTNFEAVTLTQVLLTDTLPIEASLTSFQAEGLTCSQDGAAWGGQLSCALDSPYLPQGESRVLTVTVLLSDTLPTGDFITNTVTSTAHAGEDVLVASDRVRHPVPWCAVRLNDTPMGSDIQAAIDASTQATDVVKVADICYVHDLVVNKTLNLQGGWNRDFTEWDPLVYTTTLDGGGLGGVILVDGEVSPVIEGFVITGGNSYGAGGGIAIPSASPIIRRNTIVGNQASNNGGGMVIGSGSPTIQENTFLDNTSYHYGGSSDNLVVGGGLYIVSGSPIVRANTFMGNSANSTFSGAGLGGGIYIASGSPLVENNTFTGNSAHARDSSFGGGLYNGDGSPIIQNNTFSDNNATISEHGIHESWGGGLSNSAGSAIIQNNTFAGNTAQFGGGMSNDNGHPTIQNNLFIGNAGIDPGGDSTTSYGGGLYNISGYPLIQNNIFSGNSAENGGGLYNSYGNPTIQNNTFYGNNASTGGGLHTWGDDLVLRSNIVVSNTASLQAGGIYITNGTPIMDYNDVWNNPGGDYYGVTPGAHDIATDPLLVDPAHGDFHLAPGSPCIDAGDPVNYPPTDFEGEVRPNGPAPDIGADEYYPL